MVRCIRRLARPRQADDHRQRTTRYVDTALNLVTIIASVVLIAIILLQKRETSISGAFGGNSDSIQRTRRGFDKTLFDSTIVVAVLFLIFCVLSSIFLSS